MFPASGDLALDRVPTVEAWAPLNAAREPTSGWGRFATHQAMVLVRTAVPTANATQAVTFPEEMPVDSRGDGAASLTGAYRWPSAGAASSNQATRRRPP
jgi:hypothetical protein